MKHPYLSKIDNRTWNDIQNLRNQLPEHVSVNAFINEGLRHVIETKLQGISRMKKNRESLNAMGSM